VASIRHNWFHYPNGDEAYLDLLAFTHDHGEPVSPRGQLTRELRHVTVIIDDPHLVPPLAVRRNFNYGIAAVETVQLLAGVSCLSQLDEVSKGRFGRYADDGRLLGAYGPRLYHQFPETERRLRADPDTRQAVLNLWRHDEPITEDVPCTLSLTFAVRDSRLELSVHMRSNDVMMGVPYDWFVFSRVQLIMAEVLGLEPGPYVHKVDSLHLYERDFDTARELHRAARLVDAPRFGTITAPEFSAGQVLTGHPSGWFDDWHEVQFAANVVLFDDGAEKNWWVDHTPSFTGDTCQSCRYVVDEMVTDHRGNELCARCVEW
jgi:hypothetical protein